MRSLTAAMLAALLLSPVPARARPANLKDLINKADMVMRGTSSAGVFSMQIKTSSFQRSFKIVMWDSSVGKKERSLIKILGPALWRGHGTLKVGSQLKLYNPRSNHVTVVSHSMLGDAWMGSHFTNDDLVKETRLSRHYTQRLLKRAAGKNEAGEAVTLYQVELRPRPTAPVAWGKIIYEVWERGDVVMPTRASYYRKVKQTRPDRVMTFSQVRKMGGRLVPAKMMMKVARKPGEYTSIVYKTIKFEIKIPGSKFTEQALRR